MNSNRFSVVHLIHRLRCHISGSRDMTCNILATQGGSLMLMSGRTYDCLRHDGTDGIRSRKHGQVKDAWSGHKTVNGCAPRGTGGIGTQRIANAFMSPTTNSIIEFSSGSRSCDLFKMATSMFGHENATRWLELLDPLLDYRTVTSPVDYERLTPVGNMFRRGANV
jgi:hypothetical protein